MARGFRRGPLSGAALTKYLDKFHETYTDRCLTCFNWRRAAEMASPFICRECHDKADTRDQFRRQTGEKENG